MVFLVDICSKIMTTLPTWIKYILLYSTLITLLVAFYINWDTAHPLTDTILGTHPKQPLDRRKLIELAAEVTKEYAEVDTEEHFTHRCSNCSVVISSGQLINGRAGKEIDSASCVIRMNDAPTVGYSRDVGRKTTLRVVCFKSLPFLKESGLSGKAKTDMVVVWGADKPRQRNPAAFYIKQIMDTHDRRSPIQFYSMRQEGELKVAEMFQNELGIDRVKTNSWISTGVFTMLLAINMCDRITVYGMSDENHCRRHPNAMTPYHYYSRSMLECAMYKQHQEELEMGGHRFISEKMMFRRWAEMLNIKFRQPTWNLTRLNADSKT